MLGWRRTNFDVEATIGSEEIEHPLCNAFVDCWDTCTVLRSEIDLVVQGNYRTLRMNACKRATTEEIAEHAPSTMSLRSCSLRKRKTPCLDTKRLQFPTRNTPVREKPWPAFRILVWVVKREDACEESPGRSSERNLDRQGCENAMQVV